MAFTSPVVGRTATFSCCCATIRLASCWRPCDAADPKYRTYGRVLLEHLGHGSNSEVDEGEEEEEDDDGDDEEQMS